jgi:hypothetical protein
VSPPQVPGVPGTRLPDPWETAYSKLERRVANLEKNDSTMRAQLQSYSDEDEDSQVKIPSGAPPRAKVLLGFASGLTPNGRLIIGLALIAALTLLLLRGVKLL